MSAATWPDRLLSLADWTELPEDGTHRTELVEGVLHVSPRPVVAHQRAIMRLGSQLSAQLPSGLEVLPEVEVVVHEHWPATVRIPDLVVVAADVAGSAAPRCAAEEVLVAVEVVSPGSVGTDRVTKFAEYSAAGIEHYWIVDLDHPATIAMYQLKNGHYVLVAESATTVRTDDPADLRIDPAALAG
ncbi:Uma2 family endonuclease [Bounagaea algeriensis]